ncbi:MAG: Rne/Rng family ribonuclease [Acetobacter sp.]|nr:Rne/Rng family ribonuclease [Acetobacter sp.]
MLIDDTQPEETRVVIVDGNKIEDVEFESSAKKQIKGNIFTAKVVRIEPSLQAAFVDYGGNRHGFLAFGEIHPDYYTVSDEVREAVSKEVDEIIERKRQYQAERKAEQERRRLEREQKRAEYEARKAAEEAALAAGEVAVETDVEVENSEEMAETIEVAAVAAEVTKETVTEVVADEEAPEVEVVAAAETVVEAEKVALDGCGCSEHCACRATDGHCHCAENGVCTCSEECHCEEEHSCACCVEVENEAKVEPETEVLEVEISAEEASDASAEAENDNGEEEKTPRRRTRRGARFLGRRAPKGKYKVSADASGLRDEVVAEEVDESEVSSMDDDDYDAETTKDFDNDDDEADFERYLEIQRKLIFARKLYHRSTIQEVIKEGQVLLIQIVKEERGNKGAACTTYLSLAGRYCVLMPNRIKSGGVSRKITSAADRKRLKEIIRELPLNDDMSLIVRTAGEDKQREDIVRDYNYLIRSWNHIRHCSLSVAAPALIYEEGNLIKRALRDMYTKDISEVIIDGDAAYKTAKDFSKILSPNMGRKIKCRKEGEIPVFQHYQVEKELDKLHNPVVQLQSGGYLVINPTEALVSIDVNSGRATHEMDIEETALKTNLEAADEIAKQLRMRNLAGLVVVDFIDMDEPANNHAVEKRMKEAMKPDRARVQIAKMSIFGLLEISRQRMHSSFVESNYVTCPYCRGQGVQRTIESGAMLVLRAIEEEGIKGAYNRVEVKLPQDTAIYILNHKRRILADLEEKYELEIVITADGAIKNICDYKIERSRIAKAKPVAVPAAAYVPQEEYEEEEVISADNENNEAVEREEGELNGRRSRRNRFDRRRNRSRRRDRYSRDNDAEPQTEAPAPVDKKEEEGSGDKKKAWWKKLLG